MIGQALGHYRVESQLGAGGMGVVYRARDTKLGRTVAIKLVGDRLVGEPTARERLLREARTASALNHPHICTIHEVGESDGHVYIVMEHVDGRPLRAALPAETPVAEVVRYGIQIADALAHAHERGVVHRDLKTANVLVTPEGRVKVLDFGLAKRLPGDDLSEEVTRSADALTETGQVVGTLHYMAPEVLRGQAADARTDIWALGVLLYELASGRLPFPGATRFEVTAAILEKPPEPLPARVPAGLRAVILRCLAKDPAERYQRASEVRAVLEAVASGSFVADRGRWISGRQLIGVAAAVLVLAAVALTVRVRTMPGRDIDSIAVLPFANVGSDPDTEYLSDGVTANVIGSLSTLPKLKVIAFASVLRYKGKTVGPEEVVRDLGVGATVMGRITRRSDSLSIVAELVDTTDKSRLWGKQYDVKPSEILTVQREISKQISDHIRHLSGEEASRVTKRYTENAEAYDLYLKGRYYVDKDTLEDYEKGLEFFRRATEKDPDYVPGYVGLALVAAALSADGYVRPSEGYQQMEAAILKAQKLDDTFGEVHWMLGFLKETRDWDWAGAETELQRAITLDSQSSAIHGAYGKLLRARGRWNEAIEQMRLAQSFDPLGLETNKALAYTYHWAHRYDEAITQARKTLEIDPKHWPTHELLADLYAMKGMYKESIGALQESLLASGNTQDAKDLEEDFKSLGFEAVIRQLHQATLDSL